MNQSSRRRGTGKESRKARAILDEAISEDDFLQNVKDYAELHGWLFYHPWRSYHSPKGFPDCTMIRDGWLIFAELKREKGKLTEDQAKWLKQLWFMPHPSQSHVRVFLWRPSDWPFIEETLK